MKRMIGERKERHDPTAISPVPLGAGVLGSAYVKEGVTRASGTGFGERVQRRMSPLKKIKGMSWNGESLWDLR